MTSVREHWNWWLAAAIIWLSLLPWCLDTLRWNAIRSRNYHEQRAREALGRARIAQLEAFEADMQTNPPKTIEEAWERIHAVYPPTPKE